MGQISICALGLQKDGTESADENLPSEQFLLVFQTCRHETGHFRDRWHLCTNVSASS